MTGLSPLREGRITGSRIAAVLGKSPFKTRTEVLAEMVAQSRGLPDPFQGNEGTRYGTLHEPDAIAAYIAQTGRNLYAAQKLVIHPLVPFLAYSPDALVDSDGLLEVKCPWPEGKYTHISQKPAYELQTRLGMECAQRDWCDFGVWRAGRPLAISRVENDPWWLETVMPKLEAFMDDYRAALAELRGAA